MDSNDDSRRRGAAHKQMSAESKAKSATSSPDGMVGVLDGSAHASFDFSSRMLSLEAADVEVVLYHGGCPDGSFAAYCARHVLGSDVKLKPLRRGEENKFASAEEFHESLGLRGKNVLMVDFVYERKTMNRIHELCKTLLVIDHHATAPEACEDLPDKCKVIVMEQSAATLAWNFFVPGQEAPLLYRYIEDKDLWRWSMKHSREFAAGFALERLSWETCEKFLSSGITALRLTILAGTQCLRVQRKLISDHCKASVERKLKTYPDLRVRVVNCTNYASEVANGMLEEFGACDVAMVFTYRMQYGQFTCSLRSRKGSSADCAAIAKEWSGGGHEDAAGFNWRGSNIEELFAGDQRRNSPSKGNGSNSAFRSPQRNSNRDKRRRNKSQSPQHKNKNTP